MPFLAFRLDRVLSGRPLRSPEDRARLAEQAMAVVNEHPDLNVRKLYAGQVASHTGLPVHDLVAAAERRQSRPRLQAAPTRRAGAEENAEFAAIALLLERWDDVAPWLDEAVFADDVARRGFLAVVDAEGDVTRALDLADPEARELIERAAVADLDADPEMEAFNLIAAATRRMLARRTHVVDREAVLEDREARVHLDELGSSVAGQAAAAALLGWLQRRSEEVR
jgi:DNA primase